MNIHRIKSTYYLLNMQKNPHKPANLTVFKICYANVIDLAKTRLCCGNVWVIF